MNNNYIEIYRKLEDWVIKNDYKSFDLCDVKGTKFFLNLSTLQNSGHKFGKYIVFPFNYLTTNYSNYFRKILSIEKNQYPQAQALIANSYLNLFKKTGQKDYLTKTERLLNWLLEYRTSDFNNYCWGQPYDWYSRKIIKKYTPRTTVSSQVAAAFIDMYELTNNKKYLEIVKSVCDFYLNNLHWDEDKQGDICFSYTTEDNYHIHNANMFAASILIRTWKHTNNSDYKDFGLRAANFTVKHQNDDGSWFYWAPPDKINGKIDHYHTGFVLESLFYINSIINSDIMNGSFLKGLQYYNDNLFSDNMIPKHTNKNLYPIDIQSLAQAIITYGILSTKYSEYAAKAVKVMDWTLEHMYDKEGYFYYRIYKNNRIDKSAYIRWAESWMMRALSLII